MQENEHISFSAADIAKYHSGQLSAQQMHAMEKAALDDPFLADAMEGFELQQGAALQEASTDLQSRLATRVSKNKKGLVMQFSWWKAAAVVFLLAGAALFYVAVSTTSTIDHIAKVEAPKSVTPMPADSAVGLAQRADTAIASAETAIAKNKDIPAAPIARPEAEQENDVAANLSAGAPMAKKDGRSPSTAMRRYTFAERKPDSVKDDRVAKAPLEKERHAEEKPGRAAADPAADKSDAVEIPHVFKGTVVDQSNQPIANATVQIPDLKRTVSTNTKGDFSVKARDSSLRISVSSAGYEPQNIDLATNSIDDPANVIRMKPSLINLDESIVVGRGSAKERTIKRAKDPEAEPVTGWADYNKYLEKYKKIKDGIKRIHGQVLLSFVVTTKNEIRNLKIEKSLNEEADAEAIRLVKEGPAWRVLKNKKAIITITINF